LLYNPFNELLAMTTTNTTKGQEIGSSNNNHRQESIIVATQDPRRWKALAVLSLAQFLIIMDTSIIGVALPEIQQQFGFTQSDLQWIFSAYVIVFGALLLLGGRLSDIIGQRRIFVIGFAILTAASILAGLASSGNVLIAARALQGIGAALIAPSALSIVMNLFTIPSERNKAMGFWGAAAPAGGTAGVFLGGILTAYVDWSWVFLINVPIGIAVLTLSGILLPKGDNNNKKQTGRVDYPGALSITGALVLLVYAIVTANDAGWSSLQTVSLLLTSTGLLGAFIMIQKRSRNPLIPLRIFKTTNLLASNLVMALLGAAWIPMWFFLNLYLQQIQGYGPFESGLALLPMTAAIMVLMIGASSKLIGRLRVKHSLVAGLGLLVVAMLLFVATPSTDGSFITHVLPASLVAAGGMSLAYIPALMSAVSHARKEESGLASGIVNTSYQIGSALGLAIVVTIASAQTLIDENNGVGSIDALNNGYHLAFTIAAIVAAIAGIVAYVAIRESNSSSEKEEKEVVVAVPTG
jgi:EmrB/QacA subfamily drug resistance transporter